jgi:hypothetical protein
MGLAVYRPRPRESGRMVAVAARAVWGGHHSTGMDLLICNDQDLS